MNVIEKNHAIHGRCLFLDNDVIEVGIALEFGIRICHFSFAGGKNVFYEQPLDAKMFTTREGWRLRGGHRLWIAPESEALYAPDNEPVKYRLTNDGVKVIQKVDRALNIEKQIKITLDGSRVIVDHKITNVGDQVLKCSLWALSVMAPGGVEYIPLAKREGGYDPLYNVTVWDHTSLGDDRAEYRKDAIVLTHKDVDAVYKIGVGHPCGSISYTNNGTVFYKSYDVIAQSKYPDGDVSYETFLSKHMVELESLSPVYILVSGDSAEHKEYWQLAYEKE